MAVDKSVAVVHEAVDGAARPVDIDICHKFVHWQLGSDCRITQ